LSEKRRRRGKCRFRKGGKMPATSRLKPQSKENPKNRMVYSPREVKRDRSLDLLNPGMTSTHTSRKLGVLQNCPKSKGGVTVCVSATGGGGSYGKTRSKKVPRLCRSRDERGVAQFFLRAENRWNQKLFSLISRGRRRKELENQRREQAPLHSEKEKPGVGNYLTEKVW